MRGGSVYPVGASGVVEIGLNYQGATTGVRVVCVEELGEWGGRHLLYPDRTKISIAICRCTKLLHSPSLVYTVILPIIFYLSIYLNYLLLLVMIIIFLK